MMDPMANISAPAESSDGRHRPVNIQQATSQGYVAVPNSTAVCDVFANGRNLAAVDMIRGWMGILSGMVVGIWGVTGFLRGFGCFLLLHVCTGLSIWVFKMRCCARISDYYLTPASPPSEGGTIVQVATFALSDMGKSGSSFVLFWTLFYGLVYLF
mmetsp:Transcript_45226/g.88475  ORF Transcript_45226/g.88475 Transcript_45226/m.88475 type:complete len:156 (+) Transcript_45226:116-583(+)